MNRESAEISRCVIALRQIADELARFNAREEKKPFQPPTNECGEWTHRILDALGAPRFLPGIDRLNIQERVEWLQARNG